MEDGMIQVHAGPQFQVKSVIAWNPETKEVTSGPAKGQLAENENEAIAKHQAAVEAANEECE